MLAPAQHHVSERGLANALIIPIGLETAWVKCDQKLEGNVKDLVNYTAKTCVVSRLCSDHDRTLNRWPFTRCTALSRSSMSRTISTLKAFPKIQDQCLQNAKPPDHLAAAVADGGKPRTGAAWPSGFPRARRPSTPSCTWCSPAAGQAFI